MRRSAFDHCRDARRAKLDAHQIANVTQARSVRSCRMPARPCVA
ncbi:hypothetical protein BSLA_02r2488 [Burkholderia stabilis]|nr:hypothetical protein BSLA_02r2488 [Burkholderia stabilis]